MAWPEPRDYHIGLNILERLRRQGFEVSLARGRHGLEKGCAIAVARGVPGGRKATQSFSSCLPAGADAYARVAAQVVMMADESSTD